MSFVHETNPTSGITSRLWQPSMDEPRIRIRVLRSLTEIEEIGQIWKAWQRHPNSDLDFYQAIVRSRIEIERPHVLVLYRNELPDSLLVGRIERKHIDFAIGYKSLIKVRARVLTFVYEGLLGSQCPENCARLVGAVMDCLREGEADIAVFEPLTTDSPTYECAKRLPGVLGRDYSNLSQLHWKIKIPSSFDEFLHRLPSKVRRNRKQEASRFLRELSGDVRIECLSRITEVDRLVQDVEVIAKKTYHRGLGVGFVANAENRQRLNLDAQKGRLRTYLLYAANRPCAFMIGTLYGRKLYWDFMGYDPVYRRYSPGTYLLLRIIEELCCSNVEEMDFGLGDAWYKEHFCDCAFKEAWVQIFAPTATGIWLSVLHTLTWLINEVAKDALQRSGFLLRAKKFWRTRVTPGEDRDASDNRGIS